jgi:hypothetical protein
MLVHIGGASTSILLTIQNDFKELLLIINISFSQTFDIAALLFALSKF